MTYKRPKCMLVTCVCRFGLHFLRRAHEQICADDTSSLMSALSLLLFPFVSPTSTLLLYVHIRSALIEPETQSVYRSLRLYRIVVQSVYASSRASRRGFRPLIFEPSSLRYRGFCSDGYFPTFMATANELLPIAAAPLPLAPSGEERCRCIRHVSARIGGFHETAIISLKLSPSSF